MKRLLGVLFIAFGLGFAQSPYVGAHLGLFGTSGLNIFNGGLHLGAALGRGMPEVRAGVDFSSVANVLITGFNADVLLSFPVPAAPVTPYFGLGGNLWLLPGGTTDFGAHATLGAKAPLPGTPLVGFAEFQPTYAFGGSGGFVYYLKVGANLSF